MKKITFSLLILCFTSLGFGQSLFTLYAAGKEISAQGIEVASWGGGNIASTDELATGPKSVLRISTLNLFSGGRVLFQKPVNLSELFLEPKNLLAFEFKVGGLGLVLGKPSSKPVKASATPLLSKLRCVLTTTDGKRSEAFLTLQPHHFQDSVYRVGIPLRAIGGFADTTKEVKEILITGDNVATLYLLGIQILQDKTPIIGSILAPKRNLARGDEASFKGEGSGGYSILKYTWSYDAKNRFLTDAEGQEVKRLFLTPGKYLVTLTVADQYGLKTPSTHSVEVLVNP